MTATTPRTSRDAPASERIHLQIAGMSCGSCVNHVRSALERLPGARVIDVRLGSASIELQPEVDCCTVASAIAAAGYKVIGVRPPDDTVELSIAPEAGGAEGCCCGAKAAQQPVVSLRRHTLGTRFDATPRRRRS